jgi:S1-C subfamily serine protease
MKWLLCLLVLTSCLACQPASPDSKIGGSAVALIFTNPDTSEIKPFCSGSFVAEDKILTASHCITAYEQRFKQDDDSVVIHFIIPGDQPKVDVGDEPAGSHRAKLLNIDREEDLALLQVEEASTFKHSFAAIGDKPQIGDPVSGITNPRGQYFTYGTGVVSAYRKSVNQSDFSGSFIAIAGVGFYYGSSGGCIYDSHDRIVGVVSMSTPVPNVFLIVDTSEIRAFLVKEK